MNQLFVDEFKKTTFYNQIINKYQNTVAVYLCGSRAHDLATSYSDYDITILVDEDISYDPSINYYYLLFNGVKVHWYYLSIKNFLSSHCNSSSTIYEWMACPTLQVLLEKPYLVLYKNIKYEKSLNTLCSEFIKCKTHWYALIFEKSKKYIHEITSGCRSVSSSEFKYTKYYYFLCLCSCWIRNEMLNRSLLKELKSSRFTKCISNECEKYVISTLKEYELFMENYKDNPVEEIAKAEDLIIKEVLNVR